MIGMMRTRTRIGALALLLSSWLGMGCGSRSGLHEGETTGDAGGSGSDGGLRDADRDADARDGAPSVDAGPFACRWAPALDASGAIAAPVRVDVDRVLATDVQLVAYDRGFFFLVPAGERDRLVYGRFDDAVGAEPEIFEGSSLVGLAGGGLARHGATSNVGILCNGGFVPRPDDRRLGFVFSDPCLALVSGGDRAFAWLARPSGDSQIAELRIVERSELVETFHDVATVFPPELLGATFDARNARAVFLVGEIRGAASTDRFYVADVAGASVRVATLPTADRFRRLRDLVVTAEGELASIDLAEAPVLRVYDVDGVALDERPAPEAAFDRARLGDADLAAYEGGVLANVGGVIVDFAREETRIVVDERPPGPESVRGFDLALHGRHAVSATASVDFERSYVELRHYECR
jgi:hypothetical protein